MHPALLALAILCFALRRQDVAAGGFRATLTRTEKAINFTQAAQRSHERMTRLAAGRVNTRAPLQGDGAGYLYNMELSIGTPPQKLLAMADTGSDLTWVKCGACTNCTPAGGPSYYPRTSTSFSMLLCFHRLCRALSETSCRADDGAECEYVYSYGLEADPHVYTGGLLSYETFTLGGEAVPGVGFGCTTVSEGIDIYGATSGIVGLGRGPLSLVSQLNVGAFSYCLSDGSMTSPLLFGSLAALTGAGVQSTPLLAGTGAAYYSVSLERISVGEVTTTVGGPGGRSYGMVFDSGTTFTYLAEPLYTLAKAAVLNQTTLPRVAERYGFEACFRASGVSWDIFPAIVLHFDGADMALPTSSCFMQVDDDGVMCWMVQKSPTLSIFGNVMQRGFHIRYGVDEGVLSFQRAECERV